MNSNFDRYSLDGGHHAETENIKSFELEPGKYLGITRLDKICLGLIQNCVLPFPCAYNTIAYYNFNSNTTEYLTLSSTETLSKFLTYSKYNLIVIEKINENNISKLSFISKHNSSETDDSICLEKGLTLIDLTIANKCDRFALVTAIDSNVFASIWQFDLNDFRPKKLSNSRLNSLDGMKINGVSFYPTDSNKLVIYGDNSVYCFFVKNDNLILGWRHDSDESYFSSNWLNSDQLLLGNSNGEVLIFCDNFVTKRIKTGDHSIDLNGIKVNQILRAAHGFICLVGARELIIIGKGKHDEFKINHTFKLSSSEAPGNFNQESIIDLALNSTETFLVVLTSLNKLYTIELTNELMFNNQNDTNSTLKPVKDFHSSKIISVDVCFQKCLIVTCAQDKSVKLWNFQTGSLELTQTFEEHLSCASIHPTGLYLALSFHSKIDFCNILNDQLMCTKSFKFQNPCNQCQFATGGHFIGLISNNTISVFNLWTYESISDLKFRAGKLTSFEWFNDDQNIAASSNLGIICIWNVFTGEKLIEYVEKTVKFTRLSLNLTETNLTLFALDHLNNLRLMNARLKSGKILETENVNLVFEKYINTPNTRKIKNKKNDLVITSFCFYKNLIVFGTENGSIFIKNYLSDNNKTDKQFSLHNSSICQLKIIENAARPLIVSCSEDGLLIISDLISDLSIEKDDQQQQQQAYQPNQFVYSDDILQTKNEIRKKHNYDLNLQFSLIEKNEDQAYQLRLREIEHKEQTKSINYEAKLELTRLRTLFKELKLNDEKKLEEFNRRIQDLGRKFEKDLDYVREAAENELSNEFKLHQNLAAKYQHCKSLNDSLESKLVELLQSNNMNVIDKEVDVYMQYNFFDLKEEARNDISELKRKICILKQENKKLDSEGDKLIDELKYRSDLSAREAIKKNDLIRISISLAKKDLSNLNYEINKVKEREANRDENLLVAKKKYLVKHDQVENLKKICNSVNSKLLAKEKKMHHLKIRAEQFKKAKFINEYNIKELETKLKPLIKENSELNETMKAKQLHLQTTIFNRINHLKMTKESMFSLKNQVDRKISTAKSRLNFASNFNFKISKLAADLQDLVHQPAQLLSLYNQFKPSMES